MNAFILLILLIGLEGFYGISPYQQENGPSFWDDIQTVHNVLTRSRIPRFHGSSRPFFEALTNALSDAEKSAFDRLSQGLLPDMSLEVSDIPTNVPVYLKKCDLDELDGSQALMQLEGLKVSLDPKHIKADVNFAAKFGESLQSGLTHHTVITVDGNHFGALELSPMVLYDKVGSFDEYVSSVVSFPIQRGDFQLAKKIKIPGLDALTSLPQRLYNAQIKVFNSSSLVTCIHMYLDLRQESERKAQPPPGELVYGQIVNQSVSLNLNISSAHDHMEPAQLQQQSVEHSNENTATFLSDVLSKQAPLVPKVASDHNPLTLLRNLMSTGTGNTPSESEIRQRENELLQQLQLKNLQDQLKVQEDINKKQKEEYERLKEKISKLEPKQVEQLKSTVNALISVENDKSLAQKQQEEDTQKEQQLYKQLTNLYQMYNLPFSVFPQVNPMAPAISGVQPLVQYPLFPNMNPTMVNPNMMNAQNRQAQQRLPELQFLSQLDKGMVVQTQEQQQQQQQQLIQLQPQVQQAQTQTQTQTQEQQTQQSQQQEKQKELEQELQKQLEHQALSQEVLKSNPPAQIAGDYAATSQPGQYPNPKNPQASYGDGLPANVNTKTTTELATKATNTTEEVKKTVEQVKKTEEDKERELAYEADGDLPDVALLKPTRPKFTSNDFGVSYTTSALPEWVPRLCVPFVTLISDLSFAFCVSESWQGQTAIVITEPFTAEKGFFADFDSISSPHQNRALNTTDEEYYAPPDYIGINELLLKHNYATIVVTFNPDTFVENAAFYTSEIMGALAAFVDYAGEPSMTIVTGVGWGGVLATQLLERHGGCRLHGGLVLDSPIGSAKWQSDYYGDLLSFYEWISPKAYDTIMNDRYGAISHLLLESWESVGRPYVYQSLTPVMNKNDVNTNFTNPRDLKMLEMLHALNIKCTYRSGAVGTADPDPQCLHDELANAIRKAALYVLSYRFAFNGQDPYDNFRTLYSVSDFPRLNEQLTRKLADEAPLNHQTRYLETSGLLKVPLISLSTLRDPEVPIWQNYEYVRKQNQVCESTGSRVMNDTIDDYYGHSHVDSLGTDLSEHLDVLYSLIETMRKVDDTSLAQRSWVKNPLRMVDPELASCPFQGFWYRDMVLMLRNATKAGTLSTNHKIDKMLKAYKTPVEIKPPVNIIQSPEQVASGGTSAAGKTLSTVTKGSDVIAKGTGKVVDNALSPESYSAAQSVGTTASDAASSAGGAVKNTGTKVVGSVVGATSSTATTLSGGMIPTPSQKNQS